MAGALAHLDDVISEYQTLRSQPEHGRLSCLPLADQTRLITRARAMVHRFAGRSSAYFDQCEELFPIAGYAANTANMIMGVVESLRADVAAGFLEAQRELIHGELFADFLEMAQHLLDEGYKDPAAVVAGSSLEAHLRQLCQKAGIDTGATSGGNIVPKKADRLNAELTKADSYSKGDQKNVTAWLDLRNKAAHGHYEQYEAGQVALLISGVRDFISRNPA